MPHAMPFHSTRTMEEAEDLIILHCVRGLVGNNREYVIRRQWDSDDILKAMLVAQEAFGLEPDA